MIFCSVILLLSSCAKDFVNPYDPATPPDIWMPSELTIDTLGRNALRLSWQQDELHIDGYTVRRDVSGQISEFTMPFDSLTFSDVMVVDSTVTDTCPAVLYSVMARAGENLSESIENVIPINLPLAEPVNAGDDITITDTTTTVTLSASVSSNGETGGWSIVSGEGGSFSNVDSPTSSFTGQACEQYVLRWTVYGCVNSTDDVNVNFNNGLTVANAGPDQSFSDNTTQTTISANSPSIVETGLWAIVSGTGGNISDPTDAASTFTGEACTTYILRWTISGCGDSGDDVTISFSEGTTQPDAGTDQSFTDNTTQTTLAANSPAADETGQWTITSGEGGSIADPSSPTSSFSGNSCETYVLTWSINGACGALTDQVTISFEQSTTQAAVGNDQSFTDNTTQTTISGNTPASGETGQWSIISGAGGAIVNPNSPSTSFSGQVCTTYVLRWTITGECISTFAEISITFQQMTTESDAGFDLMFTDTTVQAGLNANLPGLGETGQWSVQSGVGGSFVNPNDPNSNFLGQSCESYELSWSIYGSCYVTTDEVEVEFSQLPTPAIAGQDFSSTMMVIPLEANSPANGEVGCWTITSGQGYFSQNCSESTSFFAQDSGQMTLQWSITACTVSTDDVTISFPEYVEDVQGNRYAVVDIGGEKWMAENLRVTTYQNGEPIAHVTNDHSNFEGGYWTYYANDNSNNIPFGKLYNWTAVNDSRNICPVGYSIPTASDWSALGSNSGLLKLDGTEYWSPPNSGATNQYGFNALPGGSTYSTAGMAFQGQTGIYWTQSGTWSGPFGGLYNSASVTLEYNSSIVNQSSTNWSTGCSVRCIRD